MIRWAIHIHIQIHIHIHRSTGTGTYRYGTGRYVSYDTNGTNRYACIHIHRSTRSIGEVRCRQLVPVV